MASAPAFDWICGELERRGITRGSLQAPGRQLKAFARPALPPTFDAWGGGAGVSSIW